MKKLFPIKRMVNVIKLCPTENLVSAHRPRFGRPENCVAFVATSENIIVSYAASLTAV